MECHHLKGMTTTGVPQLRSRPWRRIAAAGLSGLLFATVLPVPAAHAFNPAPLLSRVVTAVDSCFQTRTVDGVETQYCPDLQTSGVQNRDPGAPILGEGDDPDAGHGEGLALPAR